MLLDFMKDTEKAFPKAENPSEVTGLRIWNCKYKSFKDIAEFENLEELVIASFPDESFEMLKPLRKLRYLSVLHMPNVSSLETLSTLKNVESLSLSTSPSWDSSGKSTIVESLDAIQGMNALKHLELFGVRPANKSLESLYNVKGLRSARFSQYPKKAVDEFYSITGAVNQFNPKSSFDGKAI